MKSTKKTTSISEVAQILQQKNSIALFSHTRPDGDTVGATIALALALKKLGKTVEIFCDVPMTEGVKQFEKAAWYNQTFFGKYQLLVAVDCGDVFRLGEFSGIYDAFDETMTVDHHGGEYFSKYNCLTHYASTCQIIYEVLKCLNVEIDSEIATYLYMGLCTDTGNFANSNTDVDSFLMAADMCRFGADMMKVNRVFFKDTTYLGTKVWGKAMGRMRSYFDGKLMIIFITQADLAEFGVDATISEGLVSNAIAVKTAVAGVSLCEYAPNSFKVSMRGKDFNVRDVCRQFGGNGHLVAAGCMINGFLEDVIERIVRAFSFEME
ncbi:MAG: bifunctional oligoribonuclease/PAP phosphatase NrnA [Candidatus Fimimonas sp.]